MHELGVKTSRGRRYWQPATVEHLLKRRAYRGEIHWGSFVNFAAHEPVVDERIWQMAQAKGPGLPVQRSHEPALLRGILSMRRLPTSADALAGRPRIERRTPSVRLPIAVRAALRRARPDCRFSG